jgi:hypothetical protein
MIDGRQGFMPESPHSVHRRTDHHTSLLAYQLAAAHPDALIADKRSGSGFVLFLGAAIKPDTCQDGTDKRTGIHLILADGRVSQTAIRTFLEHSGKTAMAAENSKDVLKTFNIHSLSIPGMV